MIYLGADTLITLIFYPTLCLREKKTEAKKKNLKTRQLSSVLTYLITIRLIGTHMKSLGVFAKQYRVS